MKLIAYLIMTVCLCLGTLAATVAYAPSLTLDDEILIGTTLNAPAGVIDADAEELEPIADKGTVLTSELLASIRDSGETRVRVKEFSIARWDLAWLMGASCLGLGVAAFMVKFASRREIQAELDAPTDHEDSPSQSLDRVISTIEALIRDVGAAPNEEDKNHLIIERIGSLQRVELATIADSRTTLVAVLTLMGYARFMDRFSAMERLLNRAWSAAADGVTAEAELCLREAMVVMPDVTAALRNQAS